MHKFSTNNPRRCAVTWTVGYFAFGKKAAGQVDYTCVNKMKWLDENKWFKVLMWSIADYFHILSVF